MPRRCLSIILCVALVLAAAPTARSEPAQLSRIRRHMQQRLLEVPNYTCQETIERLTRPQHARQFEELDKVRVEVAQVGRTEMLAWPGDRFEVKPLSAFVPSGLMSNGAFVMHARSLFVRDAASFRRAGGGRKLVRFDYRVTRERRGYRIRAFGQSAIVPYHGSFWADPQNLDVLRLEVYADSIPPNLQMSRAETVIEYQRIKIGSTEALLPKTAELTVTRGSRAQERNRITFTNCRQYGSESMITYAAPQEPPEPIVAGATHADVPPISVPAGLRIALILETPIEAAQAVIGTAVEAATASDVVESGRVVIPKDAKISGRVRQIRKIGKPLRAIEVGVEFT